MRPQDLVPLVSKLVERARNDGYLRADISTPTPHHRSVGRHRQRVGQPAVDLNCGAATRRYCSKACGTARIRSPRGRGTR